MSDTIYYQKYRSRTFSEMVGQEHIVKILSNAIQFDRLSHAYIFSGPRGTGKTSTARILAKSLNCEKGPSDNPCLECNLCKKITAGQSVDVIEIDAASNTGVDNIRSLNEKVNYTPVECRTKLYIIDEAHMLSTGAFNALLKTLEEPPKNTVFILATTEPQKILATIHSRCQNLNFRKLTLNEITDHMVEISKKENLIISSQCLTAVARHANGCMRDALSLLNQVVAFSGEEISEKDVYNLIGNTDLQTMVDLFKSLTGGDEATVLSTLRSSFDDGVQAVKLCVSWVQFIKNLTYAKLGLTKQIELDDEQVTQLNVLSTGVSLAWLKYALERFSKLEMELRQFPDQELLFQIRLVSTKTEGRAPRPGAGQPRQDQGSQRRQATMQATPSNKEEQVQRHQSPAQAVQGTQSEPIYTNQQGGSLNQPPGKQVTRISGTQQPERAPSQQPPTPRDLGISANALNQALSSTTSLAGIQQPVNSTPQRQPESESPPKSINSSINIASLDDLGKWKAVMAEVKEQHKSIYAILSGASFLSIESSAVKIKLKQDFKFFQDALKSTTTQDSLKPILSRFFGPGMSLDTSSGGVSATSAQPVRQSNQKKINDIVELFEGSLVEAE
ncbi:DNA polymerase III subunit gamma/tau [bacterium]|jgi:DNA polymerase III subunit gamma/tau|nr:DNA polymerase III subunit gamma/tau [bacterium]